jgi:hypothetical protein
MNKDTPTKRPMYRVAFSRITGQDQDGSDILSKPREIGAVWPRKNGKSGGILSFDHIPVELSQRRGVIFLVPADSDTKGGSQ